jgi:hypothetical protein
MPYEPNEQQNETGRGSQTCYLVLHGGIAIFETARDVLPISIFAPFMPEHVYMAGPWLGEQRIPNPITLQLTGVDPTSGCDSMANHPDNFVVFQGGTANPSSSCLEIRLPRPVNITSHLAHELNAQSIKLDGPSGVSLLLPQGSTFPPLMSDCSVFEYALDGSGAIPRLERVGGLQPGDTPQWIAKRNAVTGAFSLHVYAETDADDVDGGHSEETFGSSADTLGIQAELKARQTRPAPAQPAPIYLAPEEVIYTLADRIQQLRSIVGTSLHEPPFQEILRFTLPERPLENNNFTCGNVARVDARL